jgi:hypothetical protein
MPSWWNSKKRIDFDSSEGCHSKKRRWRLGEYADADYSALRGLPPARVLRFAASCRK